MNTETPPKPFKRIALCLSGGGFRAAAFHVGALDMLDELELLDNTKMLSTASGGTIMAVAYALAKVEKVEFGAFFEPFLTFLEKVNVVARAIDKSCESLDANKDEDVSLIRQAAEVYEKELFGGENKNFGILLRAVKEPFEELIFNTTELNLGNSFRFRASNR